ncbi:MAG: ABC transporter permease [Oceanospirillaceae bacterium]|nr:ABC transporter permease [Oceanospirillaceae bacterium]
MGLAGVFLSHYRRHPGQLAGLLLILICAAALWSGVHSLTSEARGSIAQTRAVLAPRFAIERLDGKPVGIEDFARLRRSGLCVTPQLEIRIEAGAPRLLGIDPFTAACLGESGAGASQLEVLLGGLNRTQLLGRADDLARWRQLTPAIEFEDQVVDEAPAGLLLADIAVADTFRRAGTAHLELLTSGATAEQVLPPGYRRQIVDYGVKPDLLADAFLLSLDALAALALMVAALLLRSVYRLALEQRRRTFQILRRLGVTSLRLRLGLGIEFLLLALAGSLAGGWLGAALAAGMSDGFEATLDGLFSAAAPAGPASVVSVWPGVLLLLLLVTGWAGLDLWWRSAKITAAHRRGVAMAAAATLLLAIGLLLSADRLDVIFIATALALLAVGGLLPLLLVWLLGWLQKHSRDPLQMWSCSEAGALCRLLGLPLVALAFAIAASIGVQAMVASFETTFARWLDQRLRGDLYIDPGRWLDPQQTVAALETLPGVTAVLPLVRGKGLLDDTPVDVLGVDPASPLVNGWPFLDSVATPWQALAGGGIMINEQLAWRRGLSPGDTVQLRLGDLQLQRRVVAVYADYGRPEGEVLLPLDVLPAALPERYSTFALAHQGADWRAWPERYPWLGGSRLRDQATLKAAAEAAFERTFQLTRTLESLTLVLAGTALMLMTLTMLRLRRAIYSLLYAWGICRRVLRRRLVLQTMLLTGLLGLLAIPLGLGLGWVLVARINPAAFGWSLPLGLYPGYWLQIWLLCLLIGALVGLIQGDPVRLETLKNE